MTFLSLVAEDFPGELVFHIQRSFVIFPFLFEIVCIANDSFKLNLLTCS